LRYKMANIANLIKKYPNFEVTSIECTSKTSKNVYFIEVH